MFVHFFIISEKREGGHGSFSTSDPRFQDGVCSHPSTAQTLRRWKSPAAWPQALGREALSASPLKHRCIHPSGSFLCLERGQGKGGGIKPLMFDQRRHKMPAGPAGPRWFSSPRATGCLYHLQALVWGSDYALVPAPCLSTLVGLVRGGDPRTRVL